LFREIGPIAVYATRRWPSVAARRNRFPMPNRRAGTARIAPWLIPAR